MELGSEKTPAEYVANMVRVFAMVRECLAEHGTCFVNIGDAYSRSGPGAGSGKNVDWNPDAASRDSKNAGLGDGNLCLIPQRLAIALQDAGWIVRSVICWNKPAPMPASLAGWRWMRCRVKVKECKAGGGNGNKRMMEDGAWMSRSMDQDMLSQWSDCPGCEKCIPNGGYVLRKGSWRPTSAWEPILMLAKKPGYFADGEAVKTLPAAATVSRDQYTRVLDDPDEQFAVRHDHETLCSGANARDVQTWAAEPLREKHYAAFPTALAEWCLRAGTSARGYCPTCGLPWCRVVEASKGDSEATMRPKQTSGMSSVTSTLSLSGNGSQQWTERGSAIATIGWRSSCTCNAGEPRPGKVLDPFAGSGRTLLAARRLGLDGLGIELNEEYVEMARKILYIDAPLFS